MKVPGYIITILDTLAKAGHEAYVVGGSVRDIMRGLEPKDWDITTRARPDEILALFPEAKYENIFGTVIVPVELAPGERIGVEITTYRSEQGYSDRRHPDAIRFEDEIEKDLARRDLTINAMALEIRDSEAPSPSPAESVTVIDHRLIDLFGGEKDIGKKVIRAVGEPVDRFKEDSLRLLRSVRLASELGFTIEEKTERGIVKMAGGLKFVAAERIGAEVQKILASDRPYEGMMKLSELKLLQYILPEIERGQGVDQNRHHIHNVFKHSMLALKFCPSRDWRVRFAALLHDVAKPQTKRFINGDATFYNHDIQGAKLARKIMARLKYANDDAEKVTTLVANHMFYYNVGEVTASSVRRLIRKVGRENLKDLIDLRIADRLGSGTPKAKPYKLRHLEYMMEKVQHDPVSVKMLSLNGDELMSLLAIAPGPKIGAILDVLLSEVIEDPGLNAKELLEARAIELNKLELSALREQAKEKIEEKKMEDDEELKQDFYVK